VLPSEDLEVHMARERVDCISDSLIDIASRAIYGSDAEKRLQSVNLIDRAATVADAQSIYVLDEDFVLYVAPEDFPEVSSEQAHAMIAMRSRLDPKSGSVIPEVISHGVSEGRSYLILPLCYPLATGRLTGRIDRFRITQNVLEWLRLMTARSNTGDENVYARFEESLVAMNVNAALPDRLRTGSERAISALKSFPELARSVPMHGDLWQGNIMRHKDGSLAIIDWAGSITDGYGVYDLIRFAESFKISRAKLHRELNWQAVKLGGDPGIVLPMHLLSALGHYLLNLNEFPFERFLPMAVRCYDNLVEGM